MLWGSNTAEGKRIEVFDMKRLRKTSRVSVTFRMRNREMRDVRKKEEFIRTSGPEYSTIVWTHGERERELVEQNCLCFQESEK